jgi:glucose-1-phosphate thymidylyltransferase
MKGLILSGGMGTRLRPLTYTCAKQLIPIANKPVLFYAIEALVEAGITNIGIIVGDTARSVNEAVGTGERWGARITYIQQEAPLGLAHAVKIARPFLQDERFLMYLGDNIIDVSIKKCVQSFEKPGATSKCLLMLKTVKEPQLYGIAVLDALDPTKIRSVVEKPTQDMGNLALMGIYLFDHTIFQAIDCIQPSWRGELEITDAIQYLIDIGCQVQPYIFPGRWVDTGRVEDMLEGNQIMLEDIQSDIQGETDEESTLQGNMIISANTLIQNSTIIGPVSIGENCVIQGSVIGPYVSIDRHCMVRNSTITHSIIMENCTIIDVSDHVEHSLIGRQVRLEKSSLNSKSYKLLLGDSSKIQV